VKIEVVREVSWTDLEKLGLVKSEIEWSISLTIFFLFSFLPKIITKQFFFFFFF
jgi:hypothetical protein